MGEFFGFASMLEQTAHQTTAVAVDEGLLPRSLTVTTSPTSSNESHMAGMDMLAVLGRQFHAAQQLVRLRSTRNPNQVIEEKSTFGKHIADAVALLRRLLVLHHSRSASFWSRIRPSIRFSGQIGLGSLPLHPAQPVSSPPRRPPSPR